VDFVRQMGSGWWNERKRWLLEANDTLRCDLVLRESYAVKCLAQLLSFI